MADNQQVKAPVQTQTNTLDVVVVDTAGNEYTFRLDNFRSNVTLQEVQTAFAIGINSGYWYSRAGYSFVTVKRAAKVTNIKYTEVLE